MSANPSPPAAPWVAPWALCAGLFAFVLFQFHQAIADLNGGTFTYCIDDAYIHLAIGKNLAQHGVWGVSSFEFSAASSSPLWTLVLAADSALGGPHLLLPLLLNGAALALALGLVARFWSGLGVGGGATVGGLLALVAFAPLVTLALTGMEHGLQVLLSIALVLAVSRLTGDAEPAPRAWLECAGLAFLLVACRYEGLFLVASCCALLAWRRRLKGIPALALGAALPVLLFGAYSTSRGGHFLPNSLLLKAAIPVFSSAQATLKAVGGQAVETLRKAPHLLALVVTAALAALALRRASVAEPRARGLAELLVVFALTALQHAQFARVGWMFRYEAYLVALGLTLLLPALLLLWGAGGAPARGLALVGALACAAVLGERGYRAVAQTPIAAKNIHDQQWQIGRFLGEHYAGRSVALNDIGAASLLGGIRLLDLYGLGTREVLDAIRQHAYGTETVRQLAAERGVEVAVLHPRLFAQAVPKEWQVVGQWRISGNIICNDERVWFYAVDPSKAGELAAALRDFAPKLPPDVAQEVR